MNTLSEEQKNLICRVFGLSADQIRNVSLLKKGMTNHSFRFSVNDKNYILRVPGEGTDHLVNRYAEDAAYRAVREKGFCDHPLYLDPDTGYKISLWIPHVRTCNPASTADLKRCMSLMRKLHGLNLEIPYRIDLFERIQFYESLRNGTGSIYSDYDQIKQQVFMLKDFVQEQPKACCLTHMDAVYDNFLFYCQNGEEKLQLTDWEYSGMQDPHVDLAMFCLYSRYSKEQTDQLIDLYLQQESPDSLKTKIYCYMAICGLMWSNWCEYKYIAGEHLGEYAVSQFNYAKEYSRRAIERID